MLPVVYTKNQIAQVIMDKDLHFLENVTNEPLLHFYTWKNPSITVGYFLDPKKYLQLGKLQNLSIDLARRPTGGGIVLHFWDLAFSFLLPATDKHFSSQPEQNYAFVNGCVWEALVELFGEKPLFLEKKLTLFPHAQSQNLASSFCMASPTKFDLVLEHKKIVGAAQRKKKNGYLHQGTISIQAPDLSLLQDILLSVEMAKKIYETTYFLTTSNDQVETIKRNLQDLLIKYLQKRLA